MTHLKPILALSSVGAGIALLLLAVSIQRDRFAFTSHPARNFEASTILPPLPATGPVAGQPPPLTEPRPAIPIIELDELRVLSAAPRARRSQPAQATESPNDELLQQPCNPQWRELQTGPAGRQVREVCRAPASENVPRS